LKPNFLLTKIKFTAPKIQFKPGRADPKPAKVDRNCNTIGDFKISTVHYWLLTLLNQLWLVTEFCGYFWIGNGSIVFLKSTSTCLKSTFD